MSLERQEDNINNPWWGEHLSRYEEALKFLPSKKVTILDIACGNGFGSNFLAEKGHNVIGADLSKDAIAYCKTKYNNTQMKFEVCDGTKLPYENQSFDAIISFETIEHTKAFNEMLEEFKRVVKNDGVIIISTPNRIINSPTGIITNPYHTQEWNYEELLQILRTQFTRVVLYGQAYTRYENKTQLKFKIGNWMENFLYKRGIRKLPIVIQDSLMKFIISEPMYPMASNYELVSEPDQIKKCKTFFAVCKLK